MFYAYPLPHPISVHVHNQVTRFAPILNFVFSFIHLFIVVMEGACDLCDLNYFLYLRWVQGVSPCKSLNIMFLGGLGSFSPEK